MSADDQQFLDVLSSVPSHVRMYSTEIAETIDRQFEWFAGQIRDTLAGAEWLPEKMRPTPPPPPMVAQAALAAGSFYTRVHAWANKNKILATAMVVSASWTALQGVRYVSRRRRYRRAKRAKNGARLEVVVLVGSPSSPLIRCLALDLEKRGYIVFVLCSGAKEMRHVSKLSRPDIRPLDIDVTDTLRSREAIDSFAAYLQSTHAAVPGARPHHLVLNSVILISPDADYETAPIATIAPSAFADLFNTHILYPILAVQAFLPLLTAKMGRLASFGAPRVLTVTPCVISSINPPFHAAESVVCSALTAFTEVLTAELRPLGVSVTQVQLGTFDLSGFTSKISTSRDLDRVNEVREAEPVSLPWPEPARQIYGDNFVATSRSIISTGRIHGFRGTALRDLHHSVFDVIAGYDHRGVVRVGLGADLYSMVGRWVPRTVIAWLIGVRQVDNLASWPGAGDTASHGDDERWAQCDFELVKAA